MPPGRRTTQTFKAESLVREIDCPVDQQARHPSPQSATVSMSRHPVAWQARVRTHFSRQNLSHQLISTVGVSEWHELGNKLAGWLYYNPCLFLCCSPPRESRGLVKKKSKARGFRTTGEKGLCLPSISRGEVGKGRLDFLSSTEVGCLIHPPNTSSTYSLRNIATQRPHEFARPR